jgi:anti-anti-sigma factor
VDLYHRRESPHYASTVVVSAVDAYGLGDVPRVARAISRAIAGGARAVVVDLGDGDAPEEALLGLLHRTHRRLAEIDGRLAVVGGSGVEDALAAHGLDDLLEHFPSHTAALGALSPVRLPGWASPSPADSTLERVRGEDSDVLVLAGEWDLSNAARLDLAIGDACADGARRLVVDLQGVTFADLRIVACLLAAADRLAREERELILVRPSPIVRRLLAVTLPPGRLTVHDACSRPGAAAGPERWAAEHNPPSGA